MPKNKNTQKKHIKTEKGNHWNPNETISVAIRGSDKCFYHDIPTKASGEMECYSIEEYIKVIKQKITFINYIFCLGFFM